MHFTGKHIKNCWFAVPATNLYGRFYIPAQMHMLTAPFFKTTLLNSSHRLFASSVIKDFWRHLCLVT